MAVISTQLVMPSSDISYQLSMPFAWISLFLNIPLYVALYAYFDQIIPNTYGIKKPCCFCLKRKKRRTNPDTYAALNPDES